jgi:hypothetical protein
MNLKDQHHEKKEKNSKSPHALTFGRVSVRAFSTKTDQGKLDRYKHTYTTIICCIPSKHQRGYFIKKWAFMASSPFDRKQKGKNE